MDGGHFPPVLPRPSRRVPGRRPGAAGSRPGRPQPEAAPRRREARADRRTLATLERRRRPDALGLLSGRQGALGDGPGRRFTLIETPINPEPDLMSAVLDGPRIPAAAGRTSQLVAFLHGYGADGNDLIEIGRQWRALMPEAAFVSPHAPEPCAMSSMGRQWFPLTMRDPDERWRGVVKARPILDAFLDAELAKLGLDESRLALVGFSQGTMMALHVGLRRRRAPAAIVGYSGLLIGAEHLGEAKARDARGAPPPIL